MLFIFSKLLPVYEKIVVPYPKHYDVVQDKADVFYVEDCRYHSRSLTNSPDFIGHSEDEHYDIEQVKRIDKAAHVALQR